MKTMKDVAKLAGVSHGTVSNVINGSKAVGVDKIKRVEEAMATLGYKPNAIAQNLKKSSTMQIDVILPNIVDSVLAKMYETINKFAEQKDYIINLQITNEVATTEQKLLNRSLMNNRDGVILMTCQPENIEFFENITRNAMNIVFIHREIIQADYNFVGIDVKPAIIKIVEEQILSGKERIAIITGPKEYTFEAECLSGYFYALFDLDKKIENKYIKTANCDKESALRSTMQMLNLENYPEVILVTGGLMAEGVKKAIEITCFSEKERPLVIAMNSYDWLKRDGYNQNVYLPYSKMAEEAIVILMDNIENNYKGSGKRMIIHDDNWKAENILINNEIKSYSKPRTIKILLNECPSSEAVKYLLPDFKKRTDIDVIIETKNYQDLLDEILNNQTEHKYDAFSIDIPWIKELVMAGIVQPLDDFVHQEKGLFKNFSEDIIKEYSLFDNEIYAVPYSFTVQLLFYRKDLFKKLKNQRLYYEMYKEELCVPNSWEKFNKVAKFFTKLYNPESETEYGTTLGGRCGSGSFDEFLPRLWSHGGNIFENNKITIDNEICGKALKNYVESYSYADPKAPEWWWDEQVKCFTSGKAAMMIMFTEHTSSIEDRNFSKVVGKTGFDVLPGQVSVLGGWSLAMDKNTNYKTEVLEFMKWIISSDMIVLNAVLGRVSPSKDVYNNTEFTSFYPWHRKVFDGFSYAKRRIMPENNKGECISEKILETVVGEAVHKAITKEMDEKTAFIYAAEQLSKYINA